MSDARGVANKASFSLDWLRAHSRHPLKGAVVVFVAHARGEAGAPHRVLMQRVEACRGGRGVHHEESDERRRHGAQGVARHRGGGVQARNNEESRATDDDQCVPRGGILDGARALFGAGAFRRGRFPSFFESIFIFTHQ